MLPFNTARFFGAIPDILETVFYTVTADEAMPGIPFVMRAYIPGCPLYEQPGFATMPAAHRWAQQNYGGQVAYVTPVAFSEMVGESEAGHV